MGNGFSAAICKDKFDEISGMLNGRRDSGVGGNGEPLLSVPSTNNTSNPMETPRRPSIRRKGTCD
jgi:hypothetical protein